MDRLPSTLKLGTRGSLLARTQSRLIAEVLAPHLSPGQSIELVIITTSGDVQQEKRLQDSGGKGLFVKEIDDALIDGRIDFAVHSAKDLPADRPGELMIACTPRREDPRDVWIGKEAIAIQSLPPGALVGTASLRRQAQLLSYRPDLRVVPLRGNIDTRLRKVAAGAEGISGTFLAAAGLIRANLLPPPPSGVLLPLDKYIPAAGQGTLAIEARADRADVRELLLKIHHASTGVCLHFERAIIKSLAGSCLAPIGVCALARESDPGWLVRAIVSSPDGKQVARCALMAQSAAAESLHALQSQMLDTLEKRGAREILAALG